MSSYNTTEPWEPKTGEHRMTISFSSTSAASAKRHANRLLWFSRYLALAEERNRKYKKTGKWYAVVVTCSGTLTYGVTVGMSNECRDVWYVFTSHKAAQEAADIMNRDGWGGSDINELVKELQNVNIGRDTADLDAAYAELCKQVKITGVAYDRATVIKAKAKK